MLLTLKCCDVELHSNFIFNKITISNDEIYTHYFADSSYTNKMQVE